MVRWKCCLVLAMLLLLPRVDASGDDEDDEEYEDEIDDDEEEEETESQPPRSKKIPLLECYVCVYNKSEIPSHSCLDPTKNRLQSVTCHNVDNKCFTSVSTKDNSYVEVIRGCRTGCVAYMGTSCCEHNRCNNQTFAMPIVSRAKDSADSHPNGTSKPVPVETRYLAFVQ